MKTRSKQLAPSYGPLTVALVDASSVNVQVVQCADNACTTLTCRVVVRDTTNGWWEQRSTVQFFRQGGAATQLGGDDGPVPAGVNGLAAVAGVQVVTGVTYTPGAASVTVGVGGKAAQHTNATIWIDVVSLPLAQAT